MLGQARTDHETKRKMKGQAVSFNLDRPAWPRLPLSGYTRYLNIRYGLMRFQFEFLPKNPRSGGRLHWRGNSQAQIRQLCSSSSEVAPQDLKTSLHNTYRITLVATSVSHFGYHIECNNHVEFEDTHFGACEGLCAQNFTDWTVKIVIL